MHKKGLFLAFAAIFLVMVLAWTSSLFWGSFVGQDTYYPEIFLLEYDMETGLGEENCFLSEIRSGFGTKTMMSYYAIVNGTEVFRKEIDFSQNQQIGVCIPVGTLAPGENVVDIYAGRQHIFYHAELVGKTEEKVPVVSIENAGDGRVKIHIENNDELKFAPVEISVNGKLDHRAYFSGESFESEEKVSLQEGGNEISVEFKGVAASTSAEKPVGFAINPFVGIAIMAILLSLIMFLVFASHPLIEKIGYGILSFFTLLMIVFFLLDVAGILSAQNFVLAILLITTEIAFLFRKKLKEATVEKFSLAQVKKASPLLLLLVLVIVFSSFCFNMFTTTYYSDWTVFYERQSNTIAEQEIVPVIDEFSFLGTKPFGYISGYFFVNVGVSWLAGLATQQSYAIIMVLAQAAFMAIAFLFFRSYGFSNNRSYLALITLFLGGFVFSDFSFNIRHVISYALLFLAALKVREQKPLQAGLALAVGAFVQTPVFLMFIAMLPIVLSKREMIKPALKTGIIGALAALVLFLPTLLRAGIPTQAEYNVWGYMWAIPLYGFFLDYIAVVVLIALFIVPFLVSREIKFDSFSARVGAFLALFVLIQLTISYRINVVATVAFALFIALLFPKRILENKLSEYSLATLFAVTLSLMFLLIIGFYPVVLVEQRAFGFVKENTSTEANFLNEPYLGHAFIYLSQRKSSADLAVEYANAEMIEDSFSFIKESDYTILEKYGIDYVINRSVYLDEKPVGGNQWHEILEHEELDKIYSNGLFFIHRNRK